MPDDYLEQRRAAFMANVSKGFDCWRWTAGTGGRDRRPAFNMLGRCYTAARAALILFGDGIPDGMDASHTCMNRDCVNPDHIIAETPAENQARQRRTHCKNGHEQTPENRTFSGFSSTGAPLSKCRLCHNAAMRDSYRRRKEVAR